MLVLELVGVFSLHIVLLQMHDIVVVYGVPELLTALTCTYSSATSNCSFLYNVVLRLSHFSVDIYYIMLFLP